MYCLVEFPGPSSTIAIAHSSWMVGSKCFWPPFWRNESKLKTSLINADVPDPSTWQLYQVHIIGGKMFESYDVARMKLSLPPEKIDASDLSSAEEVGRLRKRPVPGDRSSSDNDDDGIVTKPPPKSKRKHSKSLAMTLPKPPPPPPPSRPTIKPPSLVPVANFTQNAFEEGFSVPSAVARQTTHQLRVEAMETGRSDTDFQPDITLVGGQDNVHIQKEMQSSNGRVSTSPSTSRINFLEADTLTSQLSPTYPGQNSVSFPQPANPSLTFVTTPRPHISSDTGGLRDALKNIQIQQEIITGKLDMLLGMVTAVMHGRSTVDESKLTFKLPLATLEEFDSLNNQLKDSIEAKESLINVLSTRGGTNQNQITHRIMCALMTERLMCTFTFAGKGNQGKRSFKDTNIISCVCDAVRKQPKGAAASDKEIESAVEYWIKRAPQRLKKLEDGSLRSADNANH